MMKAMKYFLLGMFFYFNSFAINGLNLGVELGHVGLTGKAATYGNALGFSAEIGLFASSFWAITSRFGYSSHSQNFTMMHPSFSADLHFYQIDDFDFSIGVGPGFYFFSRGNDSKTNFGINFGALAQVCLDSLQLGIGWRWHNIFDPQIGDNFWTVAMRVGYLFEL